MAKAKPQKYDPRVITRHTLAQHELELVIDRQRQLRHAANRRRIATWVLTAAFLLLAACGWLWKTGNNWAPLATEFTGVVFLSYLYLRVRAWMQPSSPSTPLPAGSASMTIESRASEISSKRQSA